MKIMINGRCYEGEIGQGWIATNNTSGAIEQPTDEQIAQYCADKAQAERTDTAEHGEYNEFVMAPVNVDGPTPCADAVVARWGDVAQWVMARADIAVADADQEREGWEDAQAPAAKPQYALHVEVGSSIPAEFEQYGIYSDPSEMMRTIHDNHKNPDFALKSKRLSRVHEDGTVDALTVTPFGELWATDMSGLLLERVF